MYLGGFYMKKYVLILILILISIMMSGCKTDVIVPVNVYFENDEISGGYIKNGNFYVYNEVLSNKPLNFENLKSLGYFVSYKNDSVYIIKNELVDYKKTISNNLTFVNTSGNFDNFVAGYISLNEKLDFENIESSFNSLNDGLYDKYMFYFDAKDGILNGRDNSKYLISVEYDEEKFKLKINSWRKEFYNDIRVSYPINSSVETINYMLGDRQFAFAVFGLIDYYSIYEILNFELFGINYHFDNDLNLYILKFENSDSVLYMHVSVDGYIELFVKRE
jgi:hypothetical protein